MSAAPLQSRAEAVSGALPPLLVAAERVANTLVQGVHGRRRVGQGDSFWQFRHYQTGDASRDIDWRRSARSRELFVREHEWEAAQTVWLWCDPSPSMNYSSREQGRSRLAGIAAGPAEALPTKHDRAALLVLALGSLLTRAGERVSLLGEDMRPGYSRATLSRMAALLTTRRFDGAADDLPATSHARRNGVLIWVSDFLGPLDVVLDRIRACAGGGVRGHLLQVLDPAEETLPFDGRVRFEGLEGEEPLLVRRVQELRDAYRDRMDGRQRLLAETCRRVGWQFSQHRTDAPAAVPLLTLHAALSARAATPGFPASGGFGAHDGE